MQICSGQTQLTLNFTAPKNPLAAHLSITVSINRIVNNKDIPAFLVNKTLAYDDRWRRARRKGRPKLHNCPCENFSHAEHSLIGYFN